MTGTRSIRRILSLAFVAIAGMTILAHAVVPHHHHARVFVAMVNLLDEGTCAGHHHDGGSDRPDECFIHSGPVTPARLDGGDTAVAPDEGHDVVCAAPEPCAPALPEPSVCPVSFPPYHAAIHLCDAEECAGLRAPPASFC